MTRLRRWWHTYWCAWVLWAGLLPRGWSEARTAGTVRYTCAGWVVKRRGPRWLLVNPDGVIVTFAASWQVAVLYAYGYLEVR
jgi:hypothetical protein